MSDTLSYLQVVQGVLTTTALALLWGMRKAYAAGKDDERIYAHDTRFTEDLDRLQRHMDAVDQRITDLSDAIHRLPEHLRRDWENEFKSEFMPLKVSEDRWRLHYEEHRQLRNELTALINRARG